MGESTTPVLEPETDTKVRRIPPYNVVLLNDDYHSFDFVIHVLRKVFGFTQEKATQCALEAHTEGRCIVWTGSKEVAELKVDQINTYHEIRNRDGAKLGPVGCIIEPAMG